MASFCSFRAFLRSSFVRFSCRPLRPLSLVLSLGISTATFTSSLEPSQLIFSPLSSSAIPPSDTVSSCSPVCSDLFSLIGHTPLVEIQSLSRLCGRRIFVKMESLNPGQSIKDRAAREMILAAERDGRLTPGQPAILVEATGGNTGVSVALLAAQRGYQCHLTMPDSISPDKINFMRALGATVHVQPTLPFSDPNHYYHFATRLTEELKRQHASNSPSSSSSTSIPVVFLNQFENLSNSESHYRTTGPELISQLGSLGVKLNGFVCSAGTGGTIAGVTRYLESIDPSIRCALIDCPGSGLYSYQKTGQFQSSGTTIAEGVGIMRLTQNFQSISSQLDEAYQGTDREIIEMAHFLLKHEGLFVGPSAALNVLGAVKLARSLPANSSVATVICDGGEKYRHSLWNRTALEKRYPDWLLSTSGAAGAPKYSPFFAQSRANRSQDLDFVL